MTVRRGLARSAQLYGEFLGRFLIALVVLLAGLNALIAVVSSSGGPPWLRGILIYLAALIGTAWGQATMVEDVHDRHAGKGDASIPELFGRTWRIAPRIAWASFRIGILLFLLLFVGFLAMALLSAFGVVGLVAGVLLIVSSVLYLLVRWSLVVPVLVIERSDTPGAFGRSTMLVDPCIWQVLGVFFVALTIALAVDGVLGYAIADALHGWVEVWLAGIVDGLIFSSVLVAVSTALYYELSESDPVSDAIRRTSSPGAERWSEEISRLAR